MSRQSEKEFHERMIRAMDDDELFREMRSILVGHMQQASREILDLIDKCEEMGAANDDKL